MGKVKGGCLFLTSLVILFSLPYVILGGNGYGNLIGVSSDILWSCFLEYLQGGQPGIVVITAIPVDEMDLPVRGMCSMIVRNFTDYELKPHSEVIYFGEGTKASFKISRKPVRYYEDGSIGYKEYEYRVSLFIDDGDRVWWGGKLIRFEPSKPLTELTIKIRVHPLPIRDSGLRLTASILYQPLARIQLEETQTTAKYMPAVQLHSIPGISVSLRTEAGNYLYYSQKSRILDLNNNPETSWSIDGDKITPTSWGGTTPSVSNGDKRWAEAYVYYRYERWLCAGGYYENITYWKEEIITPVKFTSTRIGDMISCSRCGGSWAGSVASWPKGSTGIYYALGPGIIQIEEYGISVSFTVSYGPVALTVELWYEVSKGTAYGSPKVLVSVETWYKDWLIGFDDNTGCKVVHWTWSDAPP